MKRLIFFALLLIGAFSVNAQVDSSIKKDSLFTSEKFLFKTKNGILLNGTITIPNKFESSDKIAILLSPPQRNGREYGGMFTSLAKSLSSKGVATLRFDNRAFSDTVTKDETYTMFDQAEDAHAAFEAILLDKRFEKCQIGLIGHSEGAMSAAIEASQNKQLSFVVILSACGIKGTDYAFQQTIIPYYYLNKIPVDVRNNIVANMYKIVQFLGNTDNVSSVDKVFRDFISTHLSQINVDEKEMLVNMWLKPRQLSFLKFDPNLYYSQIRCPALIMHGMMDGLSNWEANLNGIERIFMQNDKKNYQIVALEKIDHSYQQTDVLLPAFISVSHKPGWKPEFSEKVWNRIMEWIGHL